MNSYFSYSTEETLLDGTEMLVPSGRNSANTPTTPNEEGGRPVAPLPDVPTTPNEEGGTPVAPLPTFPTFPVFPTFPNLTNRNSRARFFYAATYSVPVAIYIDSTLITSRLSYSQSTIYGNVTDGFHTVTIMSTQIPKTILYCQNMYFTANENATFCIINNATGLDVLKVSDSICVNINRNFAYLKMANLAQNSVPVDLLLSDNRIVFSSVNFKEVTTCRRATPNIYNFYVVVTPEYTPMPITNAVDIETVGTMPVSISENYIPGYGELIPVTSFTERLTSNTLYTSYLIGTDLGTQYPYQVVTLPNQ